MDDSLSEILSYQLKKLLPLIATILLILITHLPVGFPFSKFLFPDAGMIGVYFWALYRRDLFGPISVAVLGIVADSMSMVPVGINIFVFMFICLIIMVITLIFLN